MLRGTEGVRIDLVVHHPARLHRASPIVANGFVYVGSGNGTFYALHL